MIYKPATGAMWDPSVLWHDGQYYAVMMYNPEGDPGINGKRGLMATSEDGVHWRILPPPVFDWADVRSDDLEIGGVERLGGKYVLIGGVLLNGREAANANGYSRSWPSVPPRSSPTCARGR